MDSDLLPDRWHDRDFPVLRALTARFEAGSRPLRAPEIAEELGLDVDAVRMSIKRLGDAGYLVRPTNGPRLGSLAGEFVNDITPDALTATGVWPTPESALDRMIAALEAIAANTDDEDTRGRARKILDGLTGAGKSIGISVAAAAITGQIPGAGS